MAGKLDSGNYRRISREAGLTPQHVARVLKATRGCSWEVGTRIARAAGVTFDEFDTHLRKAKQPRKGRKTRKELAGE